METIIVDSFDEWRSAARRALQSKVSPEELQLRSPVGSQQELQFSGAATVHPPGDTSAVSAAFCVPPAFLKRAKLVACHRDGGRWDLLYRTLWRLTHGERHLLDIAVDDDVRRFEVMAKSVARDAHKAQAFVRFRRIDHAEGEHYVAWHRPDHRILRLVAPFFSRRFQDMLWSILTPDESVAWDCQQLVYGPGVPASEAPSGDVLDELWRTYYRSTFNPARIKLAAMRREMPVRYWRTLPETQAMPEMLAEAPMRVATMLKLSPSIAPTSAADFLPADRNLPALAAAAEKCRGCELHSRATQTIFGRGPASARIVLVGEQPGDEEDTRGEPFVGPAGRVLDDALAAAGVARQDVYVTNAVKHFHWEPRGKRRLHKKPPSRAVSACLPWLHAEMESVAPETLVCLGVTAAQALLGRDTRLLKRRGEVMATDWSQRTLITWHPAAILRARSEQERERLYSELVRHLVMARSAAPSAG